MRSLKTRIWTAALAACVLLPFSSARAEDPKAPPAKEAAATTADYEAACAVNESCPKAHSPCMEIFFEGLMLKARGTAVPFAHIEDGCGPGAVPVGPQAIVDSSYSPGGRVGMDVFCTPCSMVECHLMWWESRDASHITAPNGAVVDSNITLPQTRDCATDSILASAKLGLQLYSGDLAYNHLLCGSPGCFTVSWLAGGRYAHLREDLDANFIIGGATTVTTHITFDGGGPRVGLEGELLGKCGLSLYGRTTADFLAGHWSGSYRQTNTFAGNQGNTSFTSDRITPVLELQLGVGWTSPKGHVHVRAGYELAAWLNTVTTPDLIVATQNNAFTTNGNNLKDCITFDGLAARFEFRF